MQLTSEEHKAKRVQVECGGWKGEGQALFEIVQCSQKGLQCKVLEAKR